MTSKVSTEAGVRPSTRPAGEHAGRNQLGPVSPALGAAARRLRARRYLRSRCAASMADCIAAEAARSRAEPLATPAPDLLDLCHIEDIARTGHSGATTRA